MRKIFFLLCLSFLFIGCKTVVQKDVVLLPEDRIYTVPVGQKVHVFLDKKDLGELIFPYQMKLVHESILERNEQQLNDIALKQSKIDADSKRKFGIWGGIIAIISSLVGAWTKGKLAKKKTK